MGGKGRLHSRTRPRGQDLGKVDTIQHRHTYRDTMEDQTSRRRTHHPKGTNVEEEARRETRRETRGDDGREWETRGRQDVGKATAPPTTYTHVKETMREKGTRPGEGGPTIHHSHTCQDTIRDKG